MTRHAHPQISSRKQPRQARSPSLVAAVLQAAAQVLAKEGARRFTTARVAEQAGVSIGSLYQYFPNKAAILFRLQSDEWRQTTDMLVRILADTRKAPPERLRALVLAFLRSECDEAEVRSALADADWLDPVALSRSACLLGEALQAIEAAAETEWLNGVTEHGEGFAYAPGAGSAYIEIEVATAIIGRLGGAPRRSEVARLIERLKSGRTGNLAGVAARPVLPVGPFYMKDASIRGFVISHASASDLAQAAAGINRLVAQGQLRPRTVEVCALDEAGTAHARMERGELRGRRLIIAPDPGAWSTRRKEAFR